MFLLGLLLWMHQQRFGYIGWPLLVIFCAVMADFTLKQMRNNSYLRKTLTVAVVIGLLVNPLLTYGLLDRFRPAVGVPDYPLILFLVDKLKELCKKDRGIVLADAQFGHLIRYLTDCPVISNTMFNTVQHYKKAIQTEAMLHLSPVEIQREHPWVKYVLVVKAVYNTSAGALLAAN